METIYSITSDKGDKVYIGRTGQRLNDRKYGHHYDWKRNKHYSSHKLFEEYGYDNCVFTALEECAKEQGVERERYHIQNTPNVVNILIPGRTTKESYEEDKEKKEKRQEYVRTYCQENKDKRKEYKKQWLEGNEEYLERQRIYMRELRAKKKASQ